MLTDNPLSSGDDSFVGSRVISCFTILDTRLAHLVSHDEDSFESKFYINLLLRIFNLTEFSSCEC